MLPASPYWGWIDTFEVWMSLAATPPCLSTAVTAVALVLSSTSDACALGSVTSMSTDRVRTSGVADALPVPCTVSLGELPHRAAAEAFAAGVEFDAANPRATPPTASAAVIPITPATRMVRCSIVLVPPVSALHRAGASTAPTDQTHEGARTFPEPRSCA